MGSRWLISIMIILFPLLSSVAGAQDADQVELGELEVLRAETLDDGRVAVEITAPEGLTGTELPASAFRVTQNGVDRPISSQRLPDDDLDIVLVVDVSGSMDGAPLTGAKDAALSFLRDAPATARVALVSFGPQATLQTPFTQDFQSVADAIAALEPAGETALYDGIQLAIDQFPFARTSRRTIILLSDGEDTVSTATLDDVSTRLAGSNTDLYAIALGSVQLDPLDQMIASAESGRLALASSAGELVALYDEIAAILANQYRLIFDPADTVSTEGRVFINQLGIAAAGDFTFDAPANLAEPGAASRPEAAAESALDLPEPSFSIVEGPPISSDIARGLGIGSLGIALFIAALLLFNAGPGAVQLASNVRSAAHPQANVERAKHGAEQVADRFLARRDRGRLVGAALERAGSSFRPAEFVVLVATLAAASFAVVLLARGALAGLIAAALIVFGARSWLGYRGAQRSEEFTDQLGGTVQLLAGALRAGYALPGAFEAVSRESESPTSDEFHRLVTELRLGRDINQSLDAIRHRVGSQDFDWVVRAIDIHRQVGGDLAEILDNINATIRDRGYIRRQFKALSAEGRYSAYLLVALPFLVVIALLATSPDYVDVLFEDNRGRMMVASAATSLTIGALWLRTMLKVQF